MQPPWCLRVYLPALPCLGLRDLCKADCRSHPPSRGKTQNITKIKRTKITEEGVTWKKKESKLFLMYMLTYAVLHKNKFFFIYFESFFSYFSATKCDLGENQSVTGGDEEAVDECQELNAREERDIEIMMEGCEYAISSAEAFAERLSRELQVLDGANIQSIMASDKQVSILMKLLDEALKEVDQIELKLSSYEEMLQSVKEQMDQISESNHLIHLSNTNNVKLLSEIEFLVSHMDLAKGHIKALQEGDLSSSRGIEACTNAADALLQCVNVALRPGHDVLLAVEQQQQQQRFSDLRENFARRLASHLNNVFARQGHDQSSTLAQRSIELTLPNHHPFHRDLLRYAKLMEWLKSTDYRKYEGLTKREIKDVFEVAKIKMTGTTKESKKLGLHGSSGKLTGSTSSLNKLSVQSSGNHRSQSSSLLDMGNMSASDLDVADRARFDKIFEQVLSELEPLCLAEQDFISKFFKLQRHQSMPGTVSGLPVPSPGDLPNPGIEPVAPALAASKRKMVSLKSESFLWLSYYETERVTGGKAREKNKPAIC
ncbi:hypothetical protein FD754_023321, partial [Muntiacus muntjak]